MKLWICCLLFAVLEISTGCAGAKDYLQRGRKSFDAGKYDEASINFRNALKKDPKLGEAYYRLGLAQLRLGNTREAFQALGSAASLMPKDHQVQLAFAELCLQLYQADSRRPKALYDKLTAAASNFASEDPNSFDTLRFKGYLALFDRKLKDGIAELANANRIQPDEISVAFPLVQAMIEDQRIAEAEKLALETIQRHKEYGPMYDELYRYYLSVKRFDQAESILKTKVANNPKNGQYVLNLANYYSAQHRDAQAKGLVNGLLDHQTDYTGAYLLAGNFYAQTGDFPEASRLLREGMQRYPKDKVVYEKDLINILLAQNNQTEASQIVDQILREAPQDKDILRLRALLLLKTGQTENIDKAIAELRDLVQKTPNDSMTRMNLARAYVMKDEWENARKELTECVRISPRLLPAHELLAETMLHMRQPQPVLSEAGIVLAAQPANQRARLLEVLALIGLGRSVEARNKLNQLIKDQPQYGDAQVELGFLDLGEKKYSDAESVFRKIYEGRQTNFRAMTGLVQVLLARGQTEQALRILQAEAGKPQAPVSVRILLARTASQLGKSEIAVDQLQQAVKQDPKSYEARMLLGEYFRNKNQFGPATEMYQAAAAIAPTNAGPELYLAVAQDQAGNKDGAIAAYRAALARQPEDPVVLNDLAFYLAENGGSLDEAQSMSQRAVQKSNLANMSDTLGWIYLKKNQPDNALSIFRNLARKEPGNPLFQYHLAAALAAKGDKAGARVALRAALQARPGKNDEGKIKQLLAQIN